MNKRPEWCDIHDDWFPRGCGKCRDKLKRKEKTIAKLLKKKEKINIEAALEANEKAYLKRYQEVRKAALAVKNKSLRSINREYEEAYAKSSKESRYEPYKKFIYHSQVDPDDVQPVKVIEEWWENVKDSPWNPSQLNHPFTKVKYHKRRF